MITCVALTVTCRLQSADELLKPNQSKDTKVLYWTCMHIQYISIIVHCNACTVCGYTCTYMYVHIHLHVHVHTYTLYWHDSVHILCTFTCVCLYVHVYRMYMYIYMYTLCMMYIYM